MRSRRDTGHTIFALLKVAFVIFLTAALLGGGSSRADVLSLAIVRVAAIAVLVFVLLQRTAALTALPRAPFYYIAVVAGLMLFQLIPLPPALWATLPGREAYAHAADVAGLTPQWRPISMTPDLTINSLLSLVPVTAAFVATLMMTRRFRLFMVYGLAATMILSAILGAAQIADGPASPLRLYRITNNDAAVGFFSNRNHQAFFLACGIPLTMWLAATLRRAITPWVVNVVAALVGLFLFAATMMTGSRAGLAAVALTVIAGLPLLKSTPGPGGSDKRSTEAIARREALRGPKTFWQSLKARQGMLLLSVTVTSGIAMAVLGANRLSVFDRLFRNSLGEDLRGRVLPDVLAMLGQFFPFGAGFGSFAQVYRSIERVETMSYRYLNHAHNDLLELFVDGGIGAAILLVVFLGWWLLTAKRLWISATAGTQRDMGRLGTIITGTLLLASLVDYPLRMPFLGSLFAICCAMMLIGTANGGFEASTQGRRVET